MWAEKQIALETIYAVGSYLYIIFYSTAMYLAICPSLHLPIYIYNIYYYYYYYYYYYLAGCTTFLHFPAPI